MSNGIATLSLLAASLVALTACDGRVASDNSPRASSAAGEPSIRSQVDAANGRIWWLTRQGVFVHDAKIPQKRLVPIPGWVSVDVAYACPAALALGPNGEALVTSNILPTVWKIDRALTRAEKVALSAPMTKACGLAVGALQKAERLSRLCVRGPQGDWIVQLASDERSASVRAAPCTDLPWLLSQVT